MLHKVLMTGALVLVGQGSSIQPLVGVLFELAYLLAVLKFSPYLSDDDDTSSFVSSLAIVLTTLGAVMLITESYKAEEEDRSFNDNFVGSFMVCISAFTAGFETLMIFWSTEKGSACRTKTPCAQKKGGDKELMKARASQVAVAPVSADNHGAGAAGFWEE